MSQFSLFPDAGPSSVPASDPPDRYYPESDDLQLFTPILSCSEQTIASAPESEFLQPVYAPLSLQRVGPDRKKSFVLYSEMSKNEFINWWLQTQNGSQPDLQRRIRWNAKRISDAWKHFDQVAHHISGELMIMCRLCGVTLPHLNRTANGTNTMKRHPEIEKCRKAAKDSSRQRTL